MKLVWTAPGLDPGELIEYLTDAVRGPSLDSCEPMWVARPAWRGTSRVEEPQPPITSWATKRAVAASFGPLIRRRNLHAVLAIVSYEDDGGWFELVTRS